MLQSTSAGTEDLTTSDSFLTTKQIEKRSITKTIFAIPSVIVTASLSAKYETTVLSSVLFPRTQAIEKSFNSPNQSSIQPAIAETSVYSQYSTTTPRTRSIPTLQGKGNAFIIQTAHSMQSDSITILGNTIYPIKLPENNSFTIMQKTIKMTSTDTVPKANCSFLSATIKVTNFFPITYAFKTTKTYTTQTITSTQPSIRAMSNFTHY